MAGSGLAGADRAARGGGLMAVGLRGQPSGRERLRDGAPPLGLVEVGGCRWRQGAMGIVGCFCLVTLGQVEETFRSFCFTMSP